MWTPVCFGMTKGTVRADSAGEAQDSAWTQKRFSGRDGTNDHEQPSSVPLVPMLFGGSQDTPSTSNLEILPEYLRVCASVSSTKDPNAAGARIARRIGRRKIRMNGRQ